MKVKELLKVISSFTKFNVCVFEKASPVWYEGLVAEEIIANGWEDKEINHMKALDKRLVSIIID